MKVILEQPYKEKGEILPIIVKFSFLEQNQSSQKITELSYS